ncbi:MAG: peptidase M50 [Methanobacteriota archaeon]|nr:MAG: peptidase M50 [Euryarchaeota archaeon]
MLERIPPRERRDLLIAWLAISLSFALIFRDLWSDAVVALLFIAISFVTAGIGFILHEMAHKFTAMRFGYWAEFQKDTQMLLVAVVLAALVKVVFAAPGATVIYGTSISTSENGQISAAGPITNLVLCIPFAALVLFGGGILQLVGLIGFQVNAMVAFFNMLPLSVLDGRKVLAWNKGIFAVLFVLSLGTLIYAMSQFY